MHRMEETMNYTDKSVAISTIPKLCANGTYDFTHPLQRSSGQWNKQQKSDLIDSLFRNFHIDAVSLAKDRKKFYVIDGIQRLSTIRDFANGSLRLSANLKELPDGGSIAGKTFEELSEEQKDYFNTRNLATVQMTDYTDEELREVFRRKNNGKPLTTAQKNSVKYTPELYKTICEVTNLDQVDEKGKAVKNFWNRVVTKGIRKNSEDRNLVMQSLMLIDKNMQDADGLKCGFLATDINDYIDTFQSYAQEDQDILINKIKEASDELNKQFGLLEQQIKESRKAIKKAQEGEDTSELEKNISIAKGRLKSVKKLTIPMLVAGMSRAITNKSGVSNYMNNVYMLFDFLADMQHKTKDEREMTMTMYDANNPEDATREKAIGMEYYKYYNTSGTASKDNVNGRWNVFKAFYKK